MTDKLVTSDAEIAKNNAILAERARLLAVPVGQKDNEPSLEVVFFKLARERYAIESRYVHAVFPLVDLTPLPNVKPPLYGLTSWRGDVLTVLDLRGIFGASLNALDDLGRVIVVGDRYSSFGILADQVDSTVAVNESQILDVPDDLRGRQHILGITPDAVLVIDAPSLIRRQAE